MVILQIKVCCRHSLSGYWLPTNSALSQTALQAQEAPGQDDQTFRADDEVAQPHRDPHGFERKRQDIDS